MQAEQHGGEAIVLIPARRAATRLPDKPLADICGEPMIVHVWRRAVEAEIGPVVVATDDAAIADAVTGAGGIAELTSTAHATGSDRIHEALMRFDPERRFTTVVNLQGDLPTLAPDLIRAVAKVIQESDADIATLACTITDPREIDDPNVVKCVAALGPVGSEARAHYFSRATVPYGDGPVFHHIGIYAYRRAALERFVGLPRSPLETRESLEQLRALEDGMIIRAVHVDTVPLGVDTPRDLETARRLLAGSQSTEATS